MIYVHIDNLKTAKSYESSLLFSVYLQFNAEGGLVIPGWRFKAQYLSPPASKVGSTWFPAVYLTEELAEVIYKALRKVDLRKFDKVEPPEMGKVLVRSLVGDDVRERLLPHFQKEQGHA